ncbi:hypothetical protein [Campylobacter sp. RM12651]|uniref:hypothetical protein n=1 Tax=Campylobacter sp. RM12651 TaxID=1660079 RepID=UPI001EFB09FB|nr:hypothetical protein [Campylobacter sp. RM12651]ULO04523.1 hypothetical protein AVBRAN_a0041 [Campylobacter sp. RM12651]
MLIEIEKLAKELVKNSFLSLKEEDYKKALLPLVTFPLEDIQKLDIKEHILLNNGFRVDSRMSQEQIILLQIFKKKLIDRLLEKRQTLYEKVEKLFREESLKEKNYQEELLFIEITDTIRAIEEQRSLPKPGLLMKGNFRKKICFLFGLESQE